MDALIAFITATIVSFWGSLQLGLVNVAVIETTLSKGAKNALALAIGGVLPEIPYTLLAIYGTMYLGQYEEYKKPLGIGVGVILIGIGIFYFMRKTKDPELHPDHAKKSRIGSFFKGFGLASLNPQLIFYWSGILILLETNSLNILKYKDKLIDFQADGWISPKISFAIGASFGALIILTIYIYLARRYRHLITHQINNSLNKIVGLFFIILGLFSIIRNVI